MRLTCWKPTKQLIAALLAMLIAALGIWFTVKSANGYAPYFGFYHDDAIYTVCGKAIASGQGYRIISLPTEPLQTKYPPGFSLILALVFLISHNFPSNISLLQLVACFLGIAFLVATGTFLVYSKRATPLLALVVIGLTWLNLSMLSYMPITMADLPCAALLIFALWQCEKIQRLQQLSKTIGHQFPLARWIIVALVLSAATLTHLMAAIAIAATSVYLLVHRNFRAVLVILTVCGTFLLPYFIWINSHVITSPPVMVYYTNYLGLAKALASHDTLLSFAKDNLLSGYFDTIETLVPGFKWLFSAVDNTSVLKFITYGIVWLLLWLGLIRELFGNHINKLLVLWIILHNSVHLFYPRAASIRHMLVTLPFLYLYLFQGARLIVRHGRRAMRQVASSTAKAAHVLTPGIAPMVTALLFLGNLNEDRLWAGKYALHVPPPYNANSHYSEISEFEEAYQWIKEHTKITDVLIWNNDPGAYLWTGRKGILATVGKDVGVSSQSASATQLLQVIKFSKGTYLIIDPIFVGGLPAFTQLGDTIKSVMNRHPKLVTPVFTSRYGLVTIFKIDRSILGQDFPQTLNSWPGTTD